MTQQGHFFQAPEPPPQPAPVLTPGVCLCGAPTIWHIAVCRACYLRLSDGVRHSMHTGYPKIADAAAELRDAGRIK